MSKKIVLGDIIETYYVVIDGEFDAGEYRVERKPRLPRDSRYNIWDMKEKRWLDGRSRPFSSITRAIEGEKLRQHRELIEMQKRFYEGARADALPAPVRKRLPVPSTASKRKPSAAKRISKPRQLESRSLVERAIGFFRRPASKRKR